MRPLEEVRDDQILEKCISDFLAPEEDNLLTEEEQQAWFNAVKNNIDYIYHGNSILMIAIVLGNKECVDVAIKRNCNPNIKDSKDRTAYEFANQLAEGEGKYHAANPDLVSQEQIAVREQIAIREEIAKNLRNYQPRKEKEEAARGR